MAWILTTILLLSAAALAVLSIYSPLFLVDSAFVHDFLGSDLLGILALFMTVNAASAANIHLAFNRAEEALGKSNLFRNARRDIQQSTFVLFGLFVLAVLLMFLRHDVDNLRALAALNSALLLILLANVLVLYDITSAIFRLPSFQDSDTGNDG